MVRRVKVGKNKIELAQFLKDLAEDGLPCLLVDEDGEPLAGVVPSWQVDSLEFHREELRAMLQEVSIKNQDISAEEIEQEVEEAVRAVRGEVSR